MKILIKLALLLSLAASANATTWYVRTDGGTATQCTGKTNAPYPGTGEGAACAVNHPYWLLNQQNFAWLIAGGDTVQFEDKGPYYIGLGPYKGLGQDWPYCHGQTPDCRFAPPPSGTSTSPTRILGANAGHCGTDYTTFSGIHGVFFMMNLQATQWVDLECIEFTQPDPCTQAGHNPTDITSTQMSGGTAVYGWKKGYYNAPSLNELVTITGTTNGGGAFNVTNKVITAITGADGTSGTFTISGLSGTYAQQAETGQSEFAGLCNDSMNYASNGLSMAYLDAQGPSNATIKDIYIHGIGNSGLVGSHYNRTASDTINLINVRIFGNGLAGFNSDGGGCTTTCESIGTINLTNMDVEWNGCIQISPGVYSFCVDQPFGGNGDNLVMVATGGTWNWNHITTKNGMQDCFDSLHSGDDPNNLPTINADYIYSEGCEGATIKMSGGNVTLRNSIGISNCRVMMTGSNFPKNPPGWNGFVGLPCRAGDSFVLTASDGNLLTVENVDNIGEQGVGWDFSPIGPTGCSNSTCHVTFQNNLTLGFPTGSGQNMAGLYLELLPINPFSNPGSVITNNAWYNTKGGCPSDKTNEKNAVCGDPKLVAETNVNAINANLTSGSPLIGAGVYIAATSPDFNGTARPSRQSIGYLEYGTGPTPGPAGSPASINGNTRVGGTTVIR